VRINLVRQRGAAALKTLNLQQLQFLLFLLVDDAQIVGETEHHAHHAHHEELERQDDGSSVETRADKCRDSLIEGEGHDGEHHVGQDAPHEPRVLQPPLVNQQHTRRECPEQQEADEHVIDVATALLRRHAVPVPTQEQQVGVTDEYRADEAGQQNLVKCLVVFHSE